MSFFSKLKTSCLIVSREQLMKLININKVVCRETYSWWTLWSYPLLVQQDHSLPHLTRLFALWQTSASKQINWCSGANQILLWWQKVFLQVVTSSIIIIICLSFSAALIVCFFSLFFFFTKPIKLSWIYFHIMQTNNYCLGHWLDDWGGTFW